MKAPSLYIEREQPQPYVEQDTAEIGRCRGGTGGLPHLEGGADPGMTLWCQTRSEVVFPQIVIKSLID